jgi:putative glutamine amidotransferase
MQLSPQMTDKGGMRPLIGVTTSELRPGALATLQRAGLPPHPEIMLGDSYLRAIDAAGGIPVILAPIGLAAVPALVERLDGICLAGGPDLDPVAYGAETRHPLLGATDAGVDAFELAVARAADASGLPLLGICRGAQALNVARGGTLHQHVDGHRQTELTTLPTQSVSVAADSLLAAVTGAGETLAVNSFHHQAVDAPGAGLRVVAWAPDGTAEAIEDRARPFLLAVQWHAETLTERPEHGALFAALVRAAGARPVRLAAAA